MSRACALILAAMVAFPATALADGDDVVRDCVDDGKMSKRYSQQEYRDALADLPTDVDEYSDCRDVIRRAQLAAAGGGGSGAPGGGPGAQGANLGGAVTGGGPTIDTATPQERVAIEKAAQAGSEPVSIAGTAIQPGETGLDALGGLSAIPGPLQILLGALLTGGLAAGGMLARRRFG